MKKVWYGLTALLLSGAYVIADDLNYWDVPVSEPIPVAANITGGLTPKRANKPVVLAQSAANVQQVSAVHTPAPTLNDTMFIAAAEKRPAQEQSLADNAAMFAEIQRLNEDVEKLKKDTKKPDPKKSWSPVKVTGRLFFDSYTISQPEENSKRPVDFQNKSGFREGRIALSGTGFDTFDYKFEIGLRDAAQDINVYDAWVGAKNVPLLGYFRAGHYRIETGLGWMQGGLHTTLTEEAAPARTFQLGRKLGVSSEHLFAGDRIRWFNGLFGGTSINTSPHEVTADDQGTVFNSRLTFAPYYAQNGRYLLTFGGHYVYYASPNAERLSAKIGGMDWLANSLSTGNISANHSHRTGIEAAYQAGAFNVRSEAFWAAFAGDINHGNVASGFSTELSYFLTGENRPYSLNTATYGAVDVKRPFHPFKSGDWNLVNGWGAWQAVVQYSYLDLSDWAGAGTAYQSCGGIQNDVTFGVNWFWTSNIRWIFEYTHSQQNWGSETNYAYQDIFGTSLRVYW